MKNFPLPSFFKIRLLALLLGFLIVCFVLGAAKHVLAAYPGVNKAVYSTCANVNWPSYVYHGATSYAYNLPPVLNEETGFFSYGPNVDITDGTTVYYNQSDCGVYLYYCPSEGASWTYHSAFVLVGMSVDSPGSDNFGYPTTPPTGVCHEAPPEACPDTDSDGLCDACDDEPNDPSMGPDTYLAGYYTHDGENIGALTNRSSDGKNPDANYQVFWGHSDGRPYPGMVIGGGGGIHEPTFIEGGGGFVGFATPQKLATHSCAPLASGQTCDNPTCNVSPTQNDPFGNAPENVIKPNPGDYEYPTSPAGPQELPPQDGEDCSDRQVKCANTCGDFGIESFGCYENGGTSPHSHCDCYGGGSQGLDDDAPSWDDHDHSNPGGGCVDNPSTPQNECGSIDDGGTCVDNPNTAQDECAEYGAIGTGSPGQPYSPGEFNIGDRFNTFISRIRQTGVFALPNDFFNAPPSGGSPVFTFEFGSYGTRTVDLSDMSQPLLILRTVVLIAFGFVCLRVVILKR